MHNAPDLRALYRHPRAAAADAEDTFLIYYAGHGLTGPRRHELYLTLTDTEPDELRVTALEFELISELFAECPAANRVPAPPAALSC
ncbi:hypothetical protein [Nonomuraea rubra]|uniref:hypothetical protein n=1 Tax=Nonomuraea rubra TaxID=46180 RepID=UPI0033EF173B